MIYPITNCGVCVLTRISNALSAKLTARIAEVESYLIAAQTRWPEGLDDSGRWAHFQRDVSSLPLPGLMLLKIAGNEHLAKLNEHLRDRQPVERAIAYNSYDIAESIVEQAIADKNGGRPIDTSNSPVGIIQQTAMAFGVLFANIKVTPSQHPDIVAAVEKSNISIVAGQTR